MIPQGSEILNTQYFTDITAAMSAAESCAELQALVTEAMASINAFEAGINADLAAMLPMLSLLTAPTSPGAAISWITNYISTILTPYLKPYITLGTQLTDLLAQIATLTALIPTLSAKFPSCDITI